MYVISYDISSDRIRNKVAKTMEDYGKRVQYSVFECHLTQKNFDKLYRIYDGKFSKQTYAY